MTIWFNNVPIQQQNVSFIAVLNFLVKIFYRWPTRCEPIHRTCNMLDDRTALILVQIEFRRHASQDPFAQSSIKRMGKSPTVACERAFTHLSFLRYPAAPTAAITFSVRTVRDL